jgi:hypothetical protein
MKTAKVNKIGKIGVVKSGELKREVVKSGENRDEYRRNITN